MAHGGVSTINNFAILVQTGVRHTRRLSSFEGTQASLKEAMWVIFFRVSMKKNVQIAQYSKRHILDSDHAIWASDEQTLFWRKRGQPAGSRHGTQPLQTATVKGSGSHCTQFPSKSLVYLTTAKKIKTCFAWWKRNGTAPQKRYRPDLDKRAPLYHSWTWCK